MTKPGSFGVNVECKGFNVSMGFVEVEAAFDRTASMDDLQHEG
jgi:hypothetical protein